MTLGELLERVEAAAVRGVRFTFGRFGVAWNGETFVENRDADCGVCPIGAALIGLGPVPRYDADGNPLTGDASYAAVLGISHRQLWAFADGFDGFTKPLGDPTPAEAQDWFDAGQALRAAFLERFSYLKDNRG